MSVETIHVPLLEEGTKVWRPVSAERLSEGTFRILGPMPEDELWAFGPGEHVAVKNHVFSDGISGLVADRLADEKSFEVVKKHKGWSKPVARLDD